MNKTIITATVSIVVLGTGLFFFNPNTQEQAQIPDINTEITFDIHDDGVSEFYVLPVVITGIEILNEERYTYNDLISEQARYGRFQDDENVFKYNTVTAVMALLNEELSKLPERTTPVVLIEE
jgi:hypothetical protein